MPGYIQTLWKKRPSLNRRKEMSRNKVFIHLHDGESIVGAFCGDPCPYEAIWNGKHYEEYDSIIHIGKRPSLRVMLNFFVRAEGEMKVIEGGTVWFKVVLRVRDKYGLDKWLFEIERHRESGDPKTTYSILPEEKIAPEMRGRIEAAERHDLGAIGSGDGGDDDPPIDADTAAELVTRLKSLPRSKVDMFLGQFRVQRVRDLRVSDLEAARQLLGGLERALLEACE